MLITERWTICEKGHVHWGAAGGAGFLFRYVPQEGEPTYLLQQRSRWVDYGGTWGIPGGAVRDGESPEVTARREVTEEIGVFPSYRVTDMEVQDCGGGWKFHILTADVDEPFLAFSVQETDATGWFTKEEARSLPLHPGFQEWLDQHEPRKN
jgi:8-oxo-dGTP pyrophosphatase MutT (NUDIX family)